MKKPVTLFIVIFALLPVFMSARSGSPDPGMGELTFIKQAYTEDNSQIKAGNLALKNAMDGGVKSFGSQMAADHSQLNGQLHHLVIAKGYSFSKADTSALQPDTLLTKSHGKDFDTYYVSETLPAIKRMIALYESTLNIADPGIKQFAQKNLPLLKDHLSSVRALSNQLNIKVE